jgi:hypothetical protein
VKICRLFVGYAFTGQKRIGKNAVFGARSIFGLWKKGVRNRLKLWEMTFYVKLRLDFFGGHAFFGRVTIVGKTREMDNPNIRYNQNFVVVDRCFGTCS